MAFNYRCKYASKNTPTNFEIRTIDWIFFSFWGISLSSGVLVETTS